MLMIFPGALLHHAPRRGLRAQERAGQVDLDHALPFVEREVQGALVDADAGIVDEDVHSAELAHAVRDQRLSPKGVRHVDLEARTLRPPRTQRDSRCGGALAVDVADQHARAFVRERLRDRLADALRRAGDRWRRALRVALPCQLSSCVVAAKVSHQWAGILLEQAQASCPNVGLPLLVVAGPGHGRAEGRLIGAGGNCRPSFFSSLSTLWFILTRSSRSFTAAALKLRARTSCRSGGSDFQTRPLTRVNWPSHMWLVIEMCFCTS